MIRKVYKIAGWLTIAALIYGVYSETGIWTASAIGAIFVRGILEDAIRERHNTAMKEIDTELRTSLECLKDVLTRRGPN